MRAFRIAVVLLLLVLVGCSGSGAGTTAREMADETTVEEDGSRGRTVSGLSADGDAGGEAAAGDNAAADGGGVGAGAGEDAPAIEPLPDPPPVRAGDRVIKEGTISVEVGEGEFDDAYRAVIDAARRYGGDAVGSSTRTAENGDTFGSVTVRVPVENFEDLLVGMRNIGEVRTRDVDSQDVSAEYTDLESRLRHLQAQERFYLGLFDKADSVQDAIAVQQQLDGIQSAIEKIQGRMNFLDDRTSFSTLTVELFEPGAGAPVLADDEPTTDRPTFARYWDTARDAFVNVVGAMLVVSVFLAPLLVPALVVGALWLSRRRQRRPAPPAAPVQPEEPEPVGADH